MITPVLLSGGSGSRLWPLSRKNYPKQFVPIIGEQSLFQTTARRLSGDNFSPPLVLTNADFRFIVAEQLAATSIDPGPILIEPDARNTAPAILAAALYLARHEPDTLMLVTPLDHIIPDTKAFHSTIASGVPAAQSGKLVTFGITPTHAETGYGYLELAGAPAKGPEPLCRFIEKPDFTTAQKMLKAGNYLWNAGVFLFTARTIIAAFETHSPAMAALVKKAIARARPDCGFLRLAAEPWASIKAISIDYAVMEKADNLVVVPFTAEWSDLGCWNAIWQQSKPDASVTVTSNNATAIDCTNTLLRSEFEGLEVVGLGLDNIMAIAMPDAVLVADMNRAQDIKQIVTTLKKKGIRQAEILPRDHRPWGWFETLILADRFQVKQLVVNPGAALSLQSHFHRSEHWTVVSGTAKVTIDNDIRLLCEDQSVYIPIGVVHQLENPGKVPMVLIEVQTGTYLGEDDIIRFKTEENRQTRQIVLPVPIGKVAPM